jgi:hypothetical protein
MSNKNIIFVLDMPIPVINKLPARLAEIHNYKEFLLISFCIFDGNNDYD